MGGNPPTPPDTSALTAAISAAEAAKAGVMENTVAENVPLGTSWVTQAEMNILNTAISAAEGVKNSAAAAQSQVNAAVTALNLAIETFNSYKKDGTAPAVDKGALNAKITEAENARDGVVQVESEDPDLSNIAAGAAWATPSQIADLNDAIAAVKDIRDNATTQDEVNAAVTDLNTELSTFNTAVASNPVGTKSEGFTQSDLDALIARANDAKEGVVEADNGDDVPPTGTWVPVDVLTALENAIAAAEANPPNIDTAYLALSTALTAFYTEKNPGTTPDKSSLFNAIETANEEKAGVVIAEGEEDVASGLEWVTQSQWDIFKAVYDTSVATANNQNATKIAVDQAAGNLTAAITVFIQEITGNGPGTNTGKSLTINGLSALYDDGTTVRVGLYGSKGATQFTGYVTSAEAEVANDSVTLTFSSGALTGPYYVGFTAERIFIFASKQTISFSGSSATLSYASTGGDFGLLHHEFRLGDEGGTSGTLDQFFESVEFDSYEAFIEDEGEWMREEINSKLYSLIDVRLYHDAALTRPWSGSEQVDANTVVYSKVPLGSGYSGAQIGAISGTVTLTDIPASKPWVGIRASGNNWGSDRRPWLDLSSAGTSGTFPWTIPLYEYDVYEGSWEDITGIQPVYFRLSIRTTISDDSVHISFDDKSLDMTNKGNIQAGNVGTASLAMVTLSGTVNIMHNGQRPHYVEIVADTQQQGWIGSMTIASPGANAEWSFDVPVFASPTTVSFRVVVLDENRDRLFEEDTGVTRLVSSTDIPGIVLSMGDVSTITLEGTVNVNNGGNLIPQVYIQARTANYNYLAETSLDSPAAGAPWSLTIPAQAGGAVIFDVYGYNSSNGGNQLFNTTIRPSQTTNVTNLSISGIALNIGDITVGRMSGTVAFTNMPSPAPYQIRVSAEYGTGSNWTWINNGQGYGITVSGNNGTWIIPQDSAFLEALESGEQTVRFSLYLQATQSGNSLRIAQVEKTVSINGLDSIDLGSVNLATITLSGTATVTYNGQTVPRVQIIADTQQQNGIGSVTLNSPGPNAAWSLIIRPLASPTDVNFRVIGSDSNNNQWFSQSVVATATGISHSNVGGISVDYAHSFSLPPSSSVTPLVSDTWTDGTISASDREVWYSFTQNGGAYYVSWNDSYEGNAQKTCDVKVSAYTSNGGIIFAGVDSGWESPRAVTGQTGTVYLKVEAYSGNSTGTYAIKYSQSGAGNLSAPRYLNASVSGSSITLSWNGPNNALSYKVYRSTSADGPYNVIDSNITGTSGSGISYTDSGLNPGTYYYKVSAVFSGGEGPQTPSVSRTIITAPTGLTATASGSSQISLSWSSVSGASYYKVYRSNSSSGTYSQIASNITGTSYNNNTALSSGTTYYYKVSAVSSSENESQQSSYVSATTTGGGSSGGDSLVTAKGKLTLTGFSDFNGKYVYSALVTSSGKYLIGTNSVEIDGSVAVISMVPISGGTAQVPLYTADSSGTTVADIYVPYEGSETFQTVSIIIVDDADGKFTSSDAASFVTNYAAMITNNFLNTGFTPSTSSGNITISRTDAKTIAEAGTDIQTVKYLLMLPQ
jgi:hypothetical protein